MIRKRKQEVGSEEDMENSAPLVQIAAEDVKPATDPLDILLLFTCALCNNGVLLDGGENAYFSHVMEPKKDSRQQATFKWGLRSSENRKWKGEDWAEPDLTRITSSISYWNLSWTNISDAATRP